MLQRLTPFVAMVIGFAATCAGQPATVSIVPDASFLALSANGEFAVGRSNGRAIQWSASGGLVDLGTGCATSVSAEGPVVVGVDPFNQANASIPVSVFRWTPSGGRVLVGQCNNHGSSGPVVSRDGSTIVFQGVDGYAYRWSESEGLVQLPGLPGSGDMVPHAVSENGSVVGGYNHLSGVGPKAFKWTSGAGTTGLGWLPGGTHDACVTAMSADGGRLFGYAGTGMLSIESVYWDAAGQLHRLYTPDSLLQIVAVDGAGSTAIGIGFNTSYVWQEDAGWHDIPGLLLNDFGVDLTTESWLQAWGISDDGRTLAGWGSVVTGREAWVVHLPSALRVAPACYPNCDHSTETPVLGTSDFVCFLNKFASGVPYANCDGSTTEPVVNVADFSCFLARVAAGCP
jgi:probable HAF family extracellular repeat protein